MQNEENIKKLKAVSLKSTPIRLEMLTIFSQHNYAMSYADIQDNLSTKKDKATVYRTLKSFVEKGLLHEILDSDKSTKYATCSTGCTAIQHDHSHAHFKCSKCENIYCLEKPKIEISLPAGFEHINFTLNIDGHCANCN